jgi:AcrR family transcriptional regulator
MDRAASQAETGKPGGGTSRPTRGRPRDEEVDARILRASVEELARGGIAHFNVTAVARRAQVSKGSVYLRWPTREALIVAAADHVISPITPPEGETFRERLDALADQFGDAFGAPESLEALLRVDADRDAFPELFAQVFGRLQGARNQVFQATILDAQAAGEIPADVSPRLLNQVFVGALFVEALARTPAGDISAEFRRDLVSFIIKALCADEQTVGLLPRQPTKVGRRGSGGRES